MLPAMPKIMALIVLTLRNVILSLSKETFLLKGTKNAIPYNRHYDPDKNLDKPACGRQGIFNLVIKNMIAASFLITMMLKNVERAKVPFKGYRMNLF